VYQSSDKTCQKFQQHFNRAPPGRTTVQYLKQKFKETGNISTRKRSGRPSDEIMNEKVVNFVKENNGTNQRETARMCMTSQTSIHRYLKEEKIKPFKYSFNQALGEDNPDRRVEFCSWVVNENNVNFHRKIIFSDEASFYLNGLVQKTISFITLKE